jgi:hypothetical protein
MPAIDTINYRPQKDRQDKLPADSRSMPFDIMGTSNRHYVNFKPRILLTRTFYKKFANFDRDFVRRIFRLIEPHRRSGFEQVFAIALFLAGDRIFHRFFVLIPQSL